MCETELPELTFEQSLARLEEIVQRLEQGEDPLEETLKLFEEARRMAKRCSAQLNAVEGKLEQLVEQGGKMTIEPLELGQGRFGSPSLDDV